MEIKISRVDYGKNTVSAVVLTRSEIMSVWNKARAAQRRGQFKTSDMVIRKALGLLQRPTLYAEKVEEYGTTKDRCGCQAGQRGVFCYHRVSKMIEFRVMKSRTA